MSEERKLTLRNHLELAADELCQIKDNLDRLVVNINAIQNEWIDDDVLEDIIKLLGDVYNASCNAWVLENRLQDCDMGKWRF